MMKIFKHSKDDRFVFTRDQIMLDILDMEILRKEIYITVSYFCEFYFHKGIYIKYEIQSLDIGSNGKYFKISSNDNVIKENKYTHINIIL